MTGARLCRNCAHFRRSRLGWLLGKLWEASFARCGWTIDPVMGYPARYARNERSDGKCGHAGEKWQVRR